MAAGKTSGAYEQYSITLFIIILLVSSLACSAVGAIGGNGEAGEASAPVVEQENEGGVESAEDSGEDVEAVSESDDEQVDGDSSPEPEDASAPPPGTGGCTNVFYPMVKDQQWVYEITSAEETSRLGLTVSEVGDELATVDMLAYETGVTTSADVVCEDGAIINFPTMMLGFLFGDVDGEIELEHIEGVYSPSHAVLEENEWEYEWETDYVASGVLTAVADGESFSATLSDSPVHMEWETEGEQETVEVEAGTFEDALVVERKTEFDAALTLESDGETLSLEGTVILETKMWFMPFEGLVKQEVTRTQLKLGMATFPVESDGNIELVEFYPAE